MSEITEAFPILDSRIMVQKRVSVFMAKGVPDPSLGLQNGYENFPITGEVSFLFDAG